MNNTIKKNKINKLEKKIKTYARNSVPYILKIGINISISYLSYKIGSSIERSKMNKELDELRKSKDKEIHHYKRKSYFRGNQKYRDGVSDGRDLGRFLEREKIESELRKKRILEDRKVKEL